MTRREMPAPPAHAPRFAAAAVVAVLLHAPALGAQDAPTAGITAAAQREADPPDPVFRWGDHPSLRFGGLRLDFRARFQGDVRRSDAPLDDDDDGIDIARRRIGIDGEFRDVLGFQLERELASDVPWRDVYVDYRQFTAVRVQAGKFKLPFSLDENTSPTNLDFIYRSLSATRLAPGRDRGVMVHGRLWRRALQYEAGIFAHDGDNVRPRAEDHVHGGRTFATRITTEPFDGSRSAFSTLQMAVAWVSSEVPEGVSMLRGRTALRGRLFPEDFWVNGARRRFGLEARWLPGPFSVKAEYMRAREERLGQGVDRSDLEPIVAVGWYVSGTWAITGERKARGLDAPARPLLRGGFGALEAAARLEALGFSSGAGDAASTSPRAPVLRRNRDRAVTLGVNWYVNRWIKIQANVIRETLLDPGIGPLPGRPGFWSRVLRFQLTI